MRLQELHAETLGIPFKANFQHASAARATTEAMLVTAVTENGTRGLGEGCPRHYVSGETLKTACDFFRAHKNSFLGIRSLLDLRGWIDSNAGVIDKNPAAFCAVEMSILNTLASESACSVEALLALPELRGSFQYTAVLGTRSSDIFHAQLAHYRQLGFNDFKVKIYGESSIDNANIAALKAVASGEMRIRFDANNLWSDADEAHEYLLALDCPLFALEEPLQVARYDDCARLCALLSTRVILDESFLRADQFAFLSGNPRTWIVNLRVSKMGGIIRSLAVAGRARECGVPIIIGAQVGETSLLTRAALTVANANRDILLAQEGAFGTHLLTRDLVDPPLMFGAAGRLQIDAETGA